MDRRDAVWTRRFQPFTFTSFSKKKPSPCRVAVSAFYNDRHRKGSDVQCNAHLPHPLSEVVAKTAPLVPNSVPGEIIPVFAKKHKSRSLDKRGAAGYYNE